MKPETGSHDWMIIAIALIGMAAALVAFFRTPAEQRYKMPRSKRVRQDGVDYAEEYTKPERIRLVLKSLAIAAPIFLVLEFWASPRWSEYARFSHCYQYFGYSGTAWMLYAALVGPFVLMTLFIGIPGACDGIRIVREGRSPPRGRKVLRTTPIRTGRAATWIGGARVLLLIVLVAMSVWSGITCRRLLASLDLSRTDGCEQAPWHSHLRRDLITPESADSRPGV